MKIKLVMTAAALLIAQTVFASQEPTSCPTVASFQSTGVSSAWFDQERGIWVGVEWNNKFNTENEWTLGVGEFYSDNGDTAKVISEANQAIPGLTFQSGPMEGTDENGNKAYLCYYQGKRGTYAMAITPAVSPQSVVATMKSRHA